jgi:hypothetical protein
MRWRIGLMGFSPAGGSFLEVGVLDPSILKTERPPVTRVRSNDYCADAMRPTSPPHPPARAGSFFGTFETCLCTLKISVYWARSEVIGSGQNDANDLTRTTRVRQDIATRSHALHNMAMLWTRLR